jgi:hypothetical protein
LSFCPDLSHETPYTFLYLLAFLYRVLFSDFAIETHPCSLYHYHEPHLIHFQIQVRYHHLQNLPEFQLGVLA